MIRPFLPGERIVVSYPGHPLDGAKGVVRERQQKLGWGPNGDLMLSLAVGVDLIRKRAVIGFWLPPDKLRRASATI